jgi:hypothetical protein
MDYIYGTVVPRVRLLSITGCLGIFRVAWAEVDQHNVFCQALATGESKPLPCLNRFGGISSLPEHDGSLFLTLLPLIEDMAASDRNELAWPVLKVISYISATCAFRSMIFSILAWA